MVSEAGGSERGGVIETKDASGKPNGWLVPLWNALESEYRPQQIYLTAVLPGCVKGPHLHKVREGRFCCVSGNCDVTVRAPNGQYIEHRNLGLDQRVVIVPAGHAAQIKCRGDVEARVLNMPSPAWSKEDPDEWPVEDWRA